MLYCLNSELSERTTKLNDKQTTAVPPEQHCACLRASSASRKVRKNGVLRRTYLRRRVSPRVAAHARLMCRNEVLVQDAVVAVSVMESSMQVQPRTRTNLSFNLSFLPYPLPSSGNLSSWPREHPAHVTSGKCGGRIQGARLTPLLAHMDLHWRTMITLVLFQLSWFWLNSDWLTWLKKNWHDWTLLQNIPFNILKILHHSQIIVPVKLCQDHHWHHQKSTCHQCNQASLHLTTLLQVHDAQHNYLLKTTKRNKHLKCVTEKAVKETQPVWVKRVQSCRVNPSAVTLLLLKNRRHLRCETA